MSAVVAVAVAVVVAVVVSAVVVIVVVAVAVAVVTTGSVIVVVGVVGVVAAFIIPTVFARLIFTLHVMLAVHVLPPWAALDTLRLRRTEPVEKSSLVALATLAANSTFGGPLLLLSYVVSSISLKRIFVGR